jgi:hypothetical protein
VKKFPVRIVIVVGVAVTNLVNAADSMRVDGVRVFGRTQDTSVAEIRLAIADFLKDRSRTKPVAFEVINSRELRVYLHNRDLGWVSMRLTPTVEVDGRKHLAWSVDDCCGIPEPPEALRIIRASDEVYIFPVKNSVEPRRDDKRMRLLDKHARNELVRLLGHKSDWEPGGYAILVFPAHDVGFVFRHGKNEVVLFFCVDIAEGTVNGRNIKDLLEAKRQPQFEEWKRRYAQPELATR